MSTMIHGEDLRVLTSIEAIAALPILRHARIFLSNAEHWHQGNICFPENVTAWEASRVCTMGALVRAGHALERQRNSEHAHTYVLACLPKGYRRVADYNDAPGVGHADVLALLDQAIGLAEEMVA